MHHFWKSWTSYCFRSSSAQDTLPQYTLHFSAHMNPSMQPGTGQSPDTLNAAFCFLMLHFTPKNKTAQTNPLVYRYCRFWLFHCVKPSSVLQEQLLLEKEKFSKVKECKGKLKRGEALVRKAFWHISSSVAWLPEQNTNEEHHWQASVTSQSPLQVIHAAHSTETVQALSEIHWSQTE